MIRVPCLKIEMVYTSKVGENPSAPKLFKCMGPHLVLFKKTFELIVPGCWFGGKKKPHCYLLTLYRAASGAGAHLSS